MNPKILTLIFISMFLIVGGLSGVSAGDGDICNTGLTQGGNTCNITTSITLNASSTYYLNGTTTGTLRIISNNIIIDGNGSTLIGNGTNNLIAIFTNSKENITIKNFNIINYSIGISLESTANNLSVIYSNFSFNNRAINLRIYTNGNLTNINISHNKFNQSGIYTLSSINNRGFKSSSIFENEFQNVIRIVQLNDVENIIFENNRIINGSFYLYNSSDIKISNNTGNNTQRIFTLDYNLIDYCNNITFINNYYSNTQYGILLDNENTNIKIINNTAERVDYGIGLINGINITIEGNKRLSDNDFLFDGYWLGLKVLNATNVTIINNNFSGLLNGILIQKLNIGIIKNNYFYTIPYNSRNQTLGNSPQTTFNNQTSAMCVINIRPTFNSWIGSSQEKVDMNYTNLSYWLSNNINISNNYYDNNEQCYLINENSINLSHDLSNYWKAKYRFPSQYRDIQEYFIRNNVQELLWSNNNSQGNLYYNNYFGDNSQYGGIITNKNYSYYKNLNTTLILSLELFDLSNSLIYFNNGSVKCTSISSCDDNINFTLSPMNSSYVLNNFNLTEGISRDYSPLWFSQSSSTSKHIASNLSDTINDVTVIFNVPECTNIGSIEYESNTGTYTHTYNRGSYTCSGNQVTLEIDGIEPSTNSNEITINYNYQEQIGCSTSQSVIVNVLGFVGVLITLVVFVFIIGALWYTGNLNGTTMFVSISTLGVVLLLLVLIVYTIGTICLSII